MAPDDPVVNAALRTVALDGDEEVRRRASEALTQTPVPVATPAPMRTMILSTEC
jgi:hypothetical protein